MICAAIVLAIPVAWVATGFADHLGWRDPTGLSAFKQREAGIVNAVIETPMGSRNKFKYDENSGFYSLSGVLPLRRTPPAEPNSRRDRCPRLSIRPEESKGFYLDLPRHSEVKVSNRNNSKDRLIRGGQRAMRKVVEPLDSNFADGRLRLANTITAHCNWPRQFPSPNSRNCHGL